MFVSSGQQGVRCKGIGYRHIMAYLVFDPPNSQRNMIKDGKLMKMMGRDFSVCKSKLYGNMWTCSEPQGCQVLHPSEVTLDGHERGG